MHRDCLGCLVLYFGECGQYRDIWDEQYLACDLDATNGTFTRRFDFACQELLRESSHSAHAAHAAHADSDSEESAHGLGPAEKLTLIVSVGVPVGVVAALLSLSKAASHRAFIVLSGLAGCIGVSGVILCQHMPALLLTSMLVTHMYRAEISSWQKHRCLP